MARWKWILIILGVILIVMATFTFTSNVSQSPPMQGAVAVSSFQLLVAILGFVAIVWGIFQE